MLIRKMSIVQFAEMMNYAHSSRKQTGILKIFAQRAIMSLVDPRRLELLTSSMPWMRATNCAMGPIYVVMRRSRLLVDPV